MVANPFMGSYCICPAYGLRQPLDGHDQLRATHGVMSLGRALETALHAAEKSKGGVKRSLAAWIPWIHVDTRFFALPKFPNDSTNDCLILPG